MKKPGILSKLASMVGLTSMLGLGDGKVVSRPGGRRPGRYMRDGIYRDPTPAVRVFPPRLTETEKEFERAYSAQNGGRGILHASKGRPNSRKRRAKGRATVYLRGGPALVQA